MLKLTRRILFQKGARSRSTVTVMDPKQKIAQIEELSRELDVLLDQATANAPEKIQESVKALQADKQKLIYQVQALKTSSDFKSELYQANILRRSVNAEKIEAEKNNVLSQFERVKPTTYQGFYINHIYSKFDNGPRFREDVGEFIKSAPHFTNADKFLVLLSLLS